MFRKRNRFFKRNIIVLAVILSFTTIGTVFAYQTTGLRIYGTMTLVPHGTFGETSLHHMRLSVMRWNIAAGRDIMRISDGRHYTSGYPIRNNKNYIYKDGAGDEYIAECWMYPGMFGFLAESDININIDLRWANSAQPGYYDLCTTFLHETGHTAGLSDLYNASDSHKVMYGRGSMNTEKRFLTSDDIAGVQSIY